MSNKAGEISSINIAMSQENSGRYMNEDSVVVNVVDELLSIKDSIEVIEDIEVGEHNDYSESKSVNIKDTFGRSAMVTTFGQLAISMKDSQITEQFPYGLPGTGVVSEVTGSGLIGAVNSMLRFTTTIADGTAYAESLQALRYIPGSMAYAFFTMDGLPVGKPNCNAMGGVFDDEDGFSIGVINGIMCIRRRRFDTITLVPMEYVTYQDDWNLDKLDGTGPSGLTIDFNLMQVYSITYGYLGAAPVTFAVLSPDDQWIPFHKIKYPNTAHETHISQPYIPIRIEVDNTGSGEIISVGVGSLDIGIFNGGKTDSASRPIGVIGSKILATPKAFVGTDYVFALRGAEILGTRKNKISVLINSLSWNTDTSVKGVSVYFIKNPTILTPGTWAAISLDSPIEYSIDEVFDLDTGFPTGIASSLAKDQSRDLEVSGDATLIRRGEVIVIVCKSTNGTIGDLILGLKELL